MFEKLEEWEKWNEWKEMAEWINLFIITLDERLPSGKLILHFLDWFTTEQCFGEYDDNVSINRDERHKIIDFVFKKGADGINDLNQDIVKIISCVPNTSCFSTSRSEFMADQFWNKYKNCKEYKKLFWN